MNDEKLFVKFVPDQGKSIRSEARRIGRQQNKWIERIIAQYCPDHVFAQASKERKPELVTEWMQSAGYEFVQDDKNGDVAFVRIEDGKMTLKASFDIEYRAKA